MDTFIKTTETDSLYNNIEQKSVTEILSNINNEDKKVALAVEKSIPQIETLTHKIIAQLKKGGRLFYIGAGTSGRLGILDASECPPTFGVDKNQVIGLIAGGDTAIRTAVENAEDNPNQAWEDLLQHQINNNDIVIGIAASGTTPYVVGGLQACNENKIPTGCITCNQNSPLAKTANFPIEVVVGPEFLTGSSRMKAGTAQKMVLNMLTTTCMIKLGKVKGNKMVDMQLNNNKLFLRGVSIIQQETNCTKTEAESLLSQYKNVRTAIKNYHDKKNQ